MRLPFGKYKGQDIVDVPVNYLKWLEETIADMTPLMRESINFEINRRSGDRPGEGRTVSQEELKRKGHSK